jgi:hypothetical protein
MIDLLSRDIIFTNHIGEQMISYHLESKLANTTLVNRVLFVTESAVFAPAVRN